MELEEGVTMIKRRDLLLAGSVLGASLLSAASPASQPSPGGQKIDVLLVQSAKSLMYEPATRKMTLEGISPITFFFSDRPERIAGNMLTTVFVPFWAHGKNSFLHDPPNADVSILEGDKLRQIIVVLQDPTLENDRLSYTVKVLQGDMPEQGADVSLFIDVVGMPATPVSAAGVGRRTYRRAVVYH
jgi:hypothetical protein